MDYADILQRYTRCRAVGVELSRVLPEMLSKATIGHAARQVGMWDKGQLVLDEEQDLAVLMDYALFDCLEDGANAIERYLARHAPAAEHKMVLEAMRRAFYSLFEVESVVPGVGVQVRDLFLKQGHFIADVGFSQTAHPGTVLAARVLPFDDFLMSTGASQCMDAPTLQAILRLPELPQPTSKIAEMSFLDRADLNAEIIRLCLGPQNSVHMRYQDIEETQANEIEPVTPANKVGRNEPCPCGRGKKYKKCCGR